ncbi:MAG: histidinol-phosphatase [Thiotrichales bacterium]
MNLALFDLDNTLLAGDSDYAWGQFLVEKGVVDAATYEAANQRFYEDYKRGVLDIHEFAAFAFHPLTEHPIEQLVAWRQQFLEEKIRPIMLSKGIETIEQHRRRGDVILIITATNSFVTQPIAEAFGVSELIATEPERIDGAYTGKILGTPCFQEGKVIRLRQWLDQHTLSLDGSTFYSDSHNDIPLLESVERPVAVDPDKKLLEHAQNRQWKVLSFRN